MDTSIDEQIQQNIIDVLYKAYRNPKGRYKNVTFSVLQKDVRDLVSCEREDVLRELRYLIEKKLVKQHKERYAAYTFLNKKIPGGYTEYYSLTGSAVDQLQTPSKYGNIQYMIGRHTVRVVKKSDNFSSHVDYRGDFQPEMCFLPIDADITEGDKVQLIIDDTVKDENIAGKIKKYFGHGSLDHIEVAWMKEDYRSAHTTVNITDSHIKAPVTIGSGNHIVSYNISADTNKILDEIDKRVIEPETKEELKHFIGKELPAVLENPESNKTKAILEKVKSMGQTWLIPIITQVVGTYFQTSIGN